ncbi:RNA-binding domain-containing protein [Candidatus Ruminimicrobium bovinum]|uniref:RNA-binding domain-containing protein n=1 Tax=Candidatus Ruminimicrobium bovinum TaxID=3242779 RepID=UPI0039B8D9BF
MINRIKQLIKTGEKINVEFKLAQGGLPKNIYETVCSFLNTKGGEIILGVDDKRNVVGLPSDNIDKYKKEFSTGINNPTKLFPTVYLNMEEYTISNKKILYINIPEGSQVYKCNNKYYLRNYEGDYDITHNPTLVSNLYLRKDSSYSENKVYPYLSMEDLNQSVINKARIKAVNRIPKHPWENLNNLDLLKSASLYRKDPITKQDGFTLACVLLFGKDEIIHNIVPHYRTDLIVRIENEDRYDDRDTVDTNLIDSFDRIMQFVEKHFSSPFYLEGNIRIDIRNKIFREIAVNTLMHREYTMHDFARFIVEKDKIIMENANKPYIFGNLKPNNFRPYTKNPTIAKVFKEIGFAEELGSGVRNIMKYSKQYFGSEPIFNDDFLFTTTITNLKKDFYQKIKISNQVSEQTENNKLTKNKSTKEKILDAIRENPKITKKELSLKLNISISGIDKNIKQLRQDGIIKRLGANKNGSWQIIK